MRFIVAMFVLLFSAQARAESFVVPLAIYGGANTADFISTRYVQLHGGHELGLAGDDLTTQVVFKVASAAGEVLIDQKILSKSKTVRWITRGLFVGGYAVIVRRNIQIAVRLK